MNDSSHNRTLLSSSTAANPPFVWESAPTKRGTLQIFSLCASTTVICIWSAVHRDIPPRRLTGRRSYVLQATWVFAALFLPEFVFIYALKQLLDARRLVEKLNKHSNTDRKARWFSSWRKHENKEKNTTSEDRESLINHNSKTNGSTSFTVVHAFYAMMGGYAFDIDTPSDTSFNKKKIRAIIDPIGVQFLMKHDPELCPDFSPSSIAARSNSNGLNKALLVFQLFWFCTSCVSRLASHLPLTLLEVVTAAHGLCTLATYAAWWHKPLNVEESTLVMGERAREAFSSFTMVSRRDIGPLRKGIMSSSSVDHEAESQMELVLALRAANRYAISDEELENLSKENLVVSPPTETKSMIRSMGSLLGGLTVLSGFPESEDSEFSIADSAVLTSMTSVYGLIHLFGWNAQFPTTVERMLWRIATVAICSCGACYSVSTMSSGVLWQHKALLVEFLFHILNLIFAIVCLCIPIFYLLSTMYLLVESIRQLFYLPPNAFVVASWSNYLPHFS